MKKLLMTLFISTLCLPLFLKAQEIPKNADKIIVTNKLVAYANYVDVKILLSKKGIAIAEIDKDAFEITSGLINIKDSVYASYTFICRDDSTQVIGKFKIVATGIETVKPAETFQSVSNRGDADSVEQITFTAMNEFAKLLGKSLKYEVIK